VFSDLVEYEPGEILVRRNETAFGKFRNVGVDVPMVEPVPYLFGEYPVKIIERIGEAGDWIDFTCDGYIAYVAVAVVAGT